MSASFFALLDDIAVLAKAAAASIDDVVAGAAKASAKSAGVVIDDAAVTPQYVQGISPKRELPVIWKITRGSLLNKAIIIGTALAAGDMAHAARLLGRPYIIDGQVAHGQKIGRQLGFATANIRIKHNPLPMTGVFAVQVDGLGDLQLPGVANLGVRPTLGGTRPLLEVHLFDFDRDIYGKHISVRFVHKLRDEQRFPNFDALKAQIAADAAAARAFFKL